MSLSSLFQSAVAELRRRKLQFAVAGGFAADLYRDEPRLTMDVDFAVLLERRAVEESKDVLRVIGLQPGLVRIADLTGGPLFAIRRRSTQACMVVGRAEGDGSAEGVDLLLPVIPWVKQAVLRAQGNVVDYGFGDVPALTAEDVVVAKLFALQATAPRAKDLDDLQSIFAARVELNLAYISGQMDRLCLAVPVRLKALVPKPILALDKARRRARKL